MYDQDVLFLLQNGADGDIVEAVLDTTSKMADINVRNSENITYSVTFRNNIFTFEGTGIAVFSEDELNDTFAISLECGVNIRVCMSSEKYND